MKHFRSYGEFKLEERYEGVEVSTTRYERVHGRKPRGNGLWAFYFDPVGNEPIFAPSAMNYTDAVKWASLKARNMGKKIIYVGESVKFINEGEALIFDIVEPEFNDLKNKIADLNKKTVDPKWRKALDQIQREVEKLEFFISKYDRQLGAIETNESVESLTEMNMMLPNISDVDHTRIVKWMGNAYDYPKQYDIKRKGKDLEITIKQMNSREIEDLKAYLKSQDYINEALKIGDFVRYKKDKDFSGGKILYFMGGKATVKAWDGSELEFDPKDLEYVKSWNESVNEREYSDEERKDMADKGLALPDGSFPIKDLEDLKNAIQAYGRSKDQSATAKFIVKRAKALSAEDLIPDTEDFQKALKETITEGNAFLAARAKAIEEDAEEFEFNGKKYPVLNRPKKLNEALSDKDAYKILDIGSEFSKEISGHLLATQTFNTANDLVDYLLSEFIPKKDHKEFLKRIK